MTDDPTTTITDHVRITTDRYIYLLKCEQAVVRLGIDADTFDHAMRVAALDKVARRDAKLVARRALRAGHDGRDEATIRAAAYDAIVDGWAGLMTTDRPEITGAIADRIAMNAADRRCLELPPYTDLPDWMRAALRSGRLAPRHHPRTGQITCYTNAVPAHPDDPSRDPAGRTG